VQGGTARRYAGAVLLSVLVKVAIGATLGGIIGAIVTGDWIYSIVWAVGVPAVILLSVIGGSRGRRAPGKLGFSLARVETVQRAGANVDGSQLVDVRLTVVGDITYTTTARGTFTDEHLRTITPGSIVAVELIGANRPDVRILTNPTEAVEAELAKARLDPSQIPVASSVPAWETATTTTPGTAKPGTKAPGTPGAALQRALSFAIILAAAAAVLIPAYQSIGRGVNNIATGNWDGSDMVTGLYQQESVDQMIAVAGTSMFTDLGFYPTYILGDAISRTSDDHTDSVNWRYGRAFMDGPSFIQSSDLDAELFDAAELDISMVAKVANETVKAVGIENPESVYAAIRNNSETGEPEITVSVSGQYDDAYVTYDFDGEVIDQFGSVFEE
jgi:hypothetical protein